MYYFGQHVEIFIKIKKNTCDWNWIGYRSKSAGSCKLIRIRPDPNPQDWKAQKHSSPVGMEPEHIDRPVHDLVATWNLHSLVLQPPDPAHERRTLHQTE
jgi:hypothetical protein